MQPGLTDVIQQPTGFLTRSESENFPTFRHAHHGDGDLTDGLQDGHNPGDMDIKLEAEFYTCAFVSPLQLGQQRCHTKRMWGECFFTLAMLIVACMQCITVFGMSAYLVERDKGYTDEFKLSTLLFAEGASTIPLGRAQDLCGTFDHIALDQVAGTKRLRMPDGTEFSGTNTTPIFHTYKMPSGSWVFTSQSADDSSVDRLLRVLQGARWSSDRLYDNYDNFLAARINYGILFVVMVAILWYHVLFELRKITQFVFVLHHLRNKGFVEGREGTTSFNKADGTLAIEHLNMKSYIVGCICITMRAAVVFMMMTWGTGLLTASWNMLQLVLNALAISIIFEIDVIVAYAVVDHNTISRIENIQPITVRMPSWTFSDSRRAMNNADILFSLVMILGVIAGAMSVRSYQVDTQRHALHNTAALCLFAGPTPHGRQDVLAPVPGFCESLLSLTCGPSVRGSGSSHGPCLVTDQNIFKDRSVMLYADSDLFENMYDKNGHRRSMSKWGRPQKKLTSSRTWTSDENLNIFRRVCSQLYQPVATVDMRTVDASTGMTMHSAPFYCPREKLFQAVFGTAVTDFDKWSSTFDLGSSDIVAALDRCRMLPDGAAVLSGPSLTAAPAYPNGKPMDIPQQPDEYPRPYPTVAPAAVPDVPEGHPLPMVAYASAQPGKFLRVNSHGAHQEVQSSRLGAAEWLSRYGADPNVPVQELPMPRQQPNSKSTPASFRFHTAKHATPHVVRHRSPHVVKHKRHREVSRQTLG